MEYLNVFFDLDDTLFDFEQSERNAYARLARDLGIDGKETYALYARTNLACWKEMEKGLIRMDEIGVTRFSRFLTKLGRSDAPEDVNERFLTYLSREGIVYDGVREVLRTLRKRGKKLYVVSNGIARVQDGRLEKSGMRPYFDDIFVSERIGYPKPDKRFFDAVFAKLGITDRTSSVIIGDSLTSDMQGGRNAGIHAIWYNRKGEAPSPLADEEIASLDELL